MNSRFHRKFSNKINYETLNASLFSFSPLDGRYKKQLDQYEFSKVGRSNNNALIESFISNGHLTHNKFIENKLDLFTDEESIKINHAKEFNNVYNSTCKKLNSLGVKIINNVNECRILEKNGSCDSEIVRAELFSLFMIHNSTLLTFCKEMWYFISLGIFVQKAKAGEIGSSTMPHKINPIDFENAEGNYGIANGFLSAFIEMIANKKCYDTLITCELDNNVKNCLGYMALANSSLLKGLGKLSKNNKL